MKVEITERNKEYLDIVHTDIASIKIIDGKPNYLEFTDKDGYSLHNYITKDSKIVITLN